MKKIIFSFILLAVIQQLSFSQTKYSKWNGKIWEQLDGNGKMVEIKPAVKPFRIIEVNNINVTINVEPTAGQYTMSVSIDDNLKKFFRFKQVGDSLQITMDYTGGKYPRWLSSSNMLISVKTPSLETLVNKGNNKVEVKLQKQPVFKIAADGNPDITLTGKVSELNLQLTGNADVKAGKLLAEKINLSARGNSEIEVNTKEIKEKLLEGNNKISNLFYTDKKEVAGGENHSDKKRISLTRFSLKNNSMLPAKISLISYNPYEKGNGTIQFMLIPLGSKSFKFPEGTKIYLANNDQVNTVMSGEKIADQPPFLIVKKEDEGRSFNIK